VDGRDDRRKQLGRVAEARRQRVAVRPREVMSFTQGQPSRT
jgi:hypothetical protein